ncbi:DNA repair protein RecN [Rhabdobacter roseus]|uniref:DNA repair protein RecN n=1 Tax=Rhabdobacter roseus TaxID=1655419 RepID=A0A840TWD9_9BACT|nr:DNA repair protein RecN [Rhabdobacter roseus]MBB5283959.1 DNA repair protein RecN (Recombination protein N) [Rhabdobacter roseus]
MLANLLIKNYALIEHLELSPDPHLNIITGETGAGKSIMLGAIGLLLGNRADTKSLYDPSQKCIIEGTYDVSGYAVEHLFEEEELDFSQHCIIRREISPAGKSRAFVNDTPVNLETLRRVTNQLMDIHSQHDSILLGNNEFQLQVVDTYATNDALLKKYRTDYRAHRQAREAYDQLKAQADRMRKEFDYNNFLYQELANANLQAEEQELLERELTLLENAVEIKERLQLAYEYLENPEQSVLELLKAAIGSLNQASRLFDEYTVLRERAQSSLIELRDLADEISTSSSQVEVDDERSVIVRDRLDLIYQLQQKHQARSVAELVALQEELEAKVSKVLTLDDELVKAQTAADKAQERMLQSARKLSASRKAVTKSIQQEICRWLVELGMPNASLSIEVAEVAPTVDGVDFISFLFSANKGIRPQELRNVASGGEFSRLMMVIKYILADKRKLPTIVFDEIDTGVSGEIAIKMGDMMHHMAHNHQIIAITHLHQIAAQGEAHYFVYKDHSAARTVSRIKKLTLEERVMEIAQMIGGRRPSETVIHNAREILTQTASRSTEKSQPKLF